jgi:predicted CxxxxCH...CXXCH cytochrome family protein
MKSYGKHGFDIYRLLAGALTLGIPLFSGGMAQAAPQYTITCDFCHRMPPLDSPTGTRDAATGAVKGNHQGHAGTTAASCVKCHGDAVTAYPTGHRTKAIHVQGNINNSPAVGAYSRTFFNQTSVPPNPLGTCANVNCHFESVTPFWGSSAFLSPDDCSRCHGIAPGTGNHPVNGSKHGSYFGTGTGSCQKCHPDHASEPRPFSHATSAANRGIVVRFTSAPNSGGAYSGNGLNYLPSQNKVAFGNCTNFYCHSNGTSLATGQPASGSVAWGSSILACDGCHGTPPAYANNTPKANSHAIHNFGCGTCHAGTTMDGVTIANKSLHVNGAYNVTPGTGITFTYTYAATGGTCSNISCHGNGSATWGRNVSHDAILGTGDVLVFSNETIDHPAGFTTEMDCTVCHYANLVKQHNGLCALCHGGAAPPANALIGNWNQTCQQGSCHPSIHTAMGANHNGVYTGQSASCNLCHNTTSGDFPGPADRCTNCHSPAKTLSLFIQQYPGACANGPVRIAGGSLINYPDFLSAYAQAADTNLILLQAVNFTSDFVLNRNLRLTLEGGFDCGYTTNAGTTTVLLGNLRVQNGTVNIDQLRFR